MRSVKRKSLATVVALAHLMSYKGPTGLLFACWPVLTSLRVPTTPSVNPASALFSWPTLLPCRGHAVWRPVTNAIESAAATAAASCATTTAGHGAQSARSAAAARRRGALASTCSQPATAGSRSALSAQTTVAGHARRAVTQEATEPRAPLSPADAHGHRRTLWCFTAGAQA